MQLESSGTVIDDAGDKISHSTRFEKDRLEQPATYLENSTSVMTSNRKKVKETTSGDDATPSRPSKKLKEGDVADAPISHAVGQLRMAPIETLIQELPCGFANPTTGGTGSNQTEQPVAGNQSSTKTGSASQGMKVGNEQKSSGLGNQTPNSVKRKGRPPKSQVKIAQPFPAGEEVNTVQNAEGTVEKEYTTNNVDMDMAVGLPSNAEEGTLAENPSDHPNEESLKVMRDQKRHFDATARHKSKLWDPVVERISRRLDGWKKAYLSLGGRITLIQSCLSHIPSYFVSLFKIPVSIASKIKKMQKDFLWSGAGEGKKDHFIRWEVVSRPKELGGLGFGKISMRNIALLGKWLWRFPRERSGLWHKMSLEGAIAQVFQEFSPFVRLVVGNGERIRFWEDLWWGNQTLCSQFADLYRVVSMKNLTVSNVLGNSLPLSWNFKFKSVVFVFVRLVFSEIFFLGLVKSLKSFNVPSGQVFMELKSPFKGNGESIDHLFLHCPVTIGLWHRMFNLIGLVWIPLRSLEDMLVITFKGLGNSLRCKTLWQIACLTLIWMVWQKRNNRIFEDKGRTEEMIWDLIRFYSSLWASCTEAFRGVPLNILQLNWIGEIGKKEEGTVSTQLKRRGRPPKKLENRNPEASSEGRAPRVSFKRSPKDSSAGRAPKLPVKRSPRTSMREPKLKRQRASAVGTKIKGPKATSEGSNLNNQMELEAGLDLNSLYASAAGKDDNEVGGVAYEMAIKDCKMNEVELPMSTVVESSAKRGSQTEIPVRHSRRAYRKRTTNQNLLGSRQKNVEGIKIRTPRTRKQKLPDESIGQALSKQLVKSSSKRGRRRSININSAPPTQGVKMSFYCTGSQDALGEKTAPLVEIESKTKQVEMAVCGVASVPDDQPLSMWFDGMHSPGVADNSKLSPGQTVNQWNEARERPSEVTQSPRIDPTGEIMLDLNQSLPFVKSSPIWNTLETLEVFQRMPQKPHFRPLENCKEERREGLAIGNMVTFSTLIEKSRINELVFIKDQQEQLKGRTKEVENQIMEHTHEKTKIDEEIYEIDKKMIELQEKRALAVSNKESKDSEIAALLSSADAMNESIQSARQDFERVATSPW
ncbi:DUF724 domain-containing protein 7 [Vitis vinifera]|uniref:DUF724 domain-containing protein 7 n=1 Tax=Vitis vinifera TaxID=29760 RepID=A0A438IXY3_VITVI|nr:DUF724 domain-containing protein 7 [Vitis vinifera]